jgi:hypothetical protein
MNMSTKEFPNTGEERFIIAAKAIKESIIRNREIERGGSDCPVLVEGIKDVKLVFQDVSRQSIEVGINLE